MSRPKSSINQNFKCEVCQKTFSSNQAKRNHVIVLHENAGRFKCDFCDKTFQSSCGLKAHRRIHTGEMPFHCELCPKKFNEPGNFKRHQLDCHSERKFKCDKCGLTFGNPSSLKAHRMIHMKNFKCDQCGDVFRRADALRGHQRIHSGEKPFVCKWPDCGMRFQQKNSLHAHGQRHYKDPEELKCPICQKIFTQKSSVKLHMFLMHTDGFSHPCGQCDAKFRSYSLLTDHLLAVHDIQEETPFQCSVCSKYFLSYAGLRKHFPVHAPQWPSNCHLCLKYFETQQELDDHKREEGHTGEVRATKSTRGPRKPAATKERNKNDKNLNVARTDFNKADRSPGQSSHNRSKKGRISSRRVDQDESDWNDKSKDGDRKMCGQDSENCEEDIVADVKSERDDEICVGRRENSEGKNATKIKMELEKNSKREKKSCEREIESKASRKNPGSDASDQIAANRKKIKREKCGL